MPKKRNKINNLKTSIAPVIPIDKSLESHLEKEKHSELILIIFRKKEGNLNKGVENPPTNSKVVPKYKLKNILVVIHVLVVIIQQTQNWKIYRKEQNKGALACARVCVSVCGCVHSCALRCITSFFVHYLNTILEAFPIRLASLSHASHQHSPLSHGFLK